MRLAVAVALASLAGCASTGPRSSSDDAAAFAKLKSLAGDWSQTGQTDAPAGSSVTYRVTAGGSAVVETDFPGTPMEMVTLYTLDRGSLRLTHYCMMGNQPSMRLARMDGDTLVFAFDGLGNGDAATDAHMHEAKITLLDAARVKTAWTLWEGGKPGDTHGFDLARR